MIDTITEPMQGLASYLRAEARSCVIGKDTRATLMEWASEVEAALAAPQPVQGPVADLNLTTLRLAFIAVAFGIQNKVPEMPADAREVLTKIMPWIDKYMPDDYDSTAEAMDVLRKHNSHNSLPTLKSQSQPDHHQ